MAVRQRTLERLAWRALSAADAACNRLYGWRGNPLYQSGTIVVALLAVLLVTGVWLLIFYRLGAPYESVERLTANGWYGNWVRGLHRYASDAAIVATAVHALRMFAQGRSWGPRVLAWITGAVLLLSLMLCGWTGYVMVWDDFALVLAREGARMLDALPVLSEPTSRVFAGERAVPSAFFFVNLFAHVAVPLGMAVGLWLHVSRIARSQLLPPRSLTWSLIGALTALAIAAPVPMEPPASAFLVPESVTADLFYAFWLPAARAMPAGVSLALGLLAFGAVAAIPAMTRRRGAARAEPSSVDEGLCRGCRQCTLDCPWAAITMIQRVGTGPSAEVARVNPELCVSCGICAGSCAPMGVGPPGRTGRDQLRTVQAFLREGGRETNELVVIYCDRGDPARARTVAASRAAGYPVDCAGSLHTSVVELLIRWGSGGVLILACPPRDCWNREGPRWLNERLFHDREAELQARVDRRRVRLAHADVRDDGAVRDAIRGFAADLAELGGAVADSAPPADVECEPAELEHDR